MAPQRAVKGRLVESPLAERLILVVEDEPIIAMDVVQSLRRAGASVTQARSLSDALCKVEAPGLAAAVIDHGLHDGDASQVCDRLDQRGIPFVVYSGYDYVAGPCSEGKHVPKPVPPAALVQAVAEVIRQHHAPPDGAAPAPKRS